jgi:hypothetical protein
MVALTLLSLAIRNHFLGSIGGGDAHLSLENLGPTSRGQGVLLFVNEWVRLLLWPARLQVEYGPPGLDPSSPFGTAHILGLALIGLAAGILAWSWRRRPAVALGLTWIVIGITPVSNLFFPTGVLVAERTLFLPSVGLAIMLSGAIGNWERLPSRGKLGRAGAVAVLATIIAIAGIRSATRQPHWRSTLALLRHDQAIAATTYRVHYMLGQELWKAGDRPGAEASLTRAVALWDHDPRPFQDLGQLLRVRGNCHEAIPILTRGLVADSTGDIARSRLIECLIVERRWDEAEQEIDRGLAQGVRAYENARTRVRAGRRVEPTG